MHLNSGSSLRYPVRFAGDIREVFLTGEGFFEVIKRRGCDHFVVGKTVGG